ncbi:hypothetical protein Sjap_010896 [Stephania japonica]|uniref:Uncharacterized protein n=1 Tax=Stephania japonica TaxID=461633 RepID=A0AAP0JA95_9MAGN
MKGKYVRENHCGHAVLTSSLASGVWRTICKLWPTFLEGITLRLGNGASVKFWIDQWVEGQGRLLPFALKELTKEDLNASVNEFITVDGRWNWTKLRNNLPTWGGGRGRFDVVAL